MTRDALDEELFNVRQQAEREAHAFDEQLRRVYDESVAVARRLEAERDEALAAIKAWADADDGTIAERQHAREALHAFLESSTPMTRDNQKAR